MRVSRRFVLGAGLAGVIVSGIACGRSAVPPADVARSALETALTAWRDGKKPADVAQASPPIQAVDNEWTTGRKLVSFEIGDEKPSETDKQFVVKLKFDKATKDEEVTYVIIGTDPVAVYREADFLRMLNMDNNPKSKPTSKRRN
jgi:hypothetical protein